MCREYLETWADCGSILDQAEVVVIVGYSFNVFDEHFNDLLRKSNQNTRIIVLNRSLDAVVPNVIGVLRTILNDLNEVQIGGLPCLHDGRLTFVPISSDQVEPVLLHELIGSPVPTPRRARTHRVRRR